MLILLRKLIAFVTGKRPCSYTSRHGHDFELVGRLFTGSPIRAVVFQCTVCGQVGTFDQWSLGIELQSPGVLTFMEPATHPTDSGGDDA